MNFLFSAHPSTRIGPLPGITQTEKEIDKLYGLPSMNMRNRHIRYVHSSDLENLIDGQDLASSPDEETDVDPDELFDFDLSRAMDRLLLLERFHPERACLVRAHFLGRVTQDALAEQHGISQPSVCSKIKTGIEWMRSLSDDAVWFLMLEEGERREIIASFVSKPNLIDAILAYTSGQLQTVACAGRCSQPTLSSWLNRLIASADSVPMVDALKSICN